MSDGTLRFEASIDLSAIETETNRKLALQQWLIEIAGMVRCDGYAGNRYDPETRAIIGRWSVDGRRVDGDV